MTTEKELNKVLWEAIDNDDADLLKEAFRRGAKLPEYLGTHWKREQENFHSLNKMMETWLVNLRHEVMHGEGSAEHTCRACIGKVHTTLGRGSEDDEVAIRLDIEELADFNILRELLDYPDGVVVTMGTVVRSRCGEDPAMAADYQLLEERNRQLELRVEQLCSLDFGWRDLAPSLQDARRQQVSAMANVQKETHPDNHYLWRDQPHNLQPQTSDRIQSH